MPDLLHLLQGHDLGHVRIAAELWGIQLGAKDVDAAIREFAAGTHEARLAAEVIEALSPQARSGLTALEHAGGRIPWAGFSRRFGEIREMGAARRDREKPHLHPVSPAEELFYRALLGQAFFESGDAAQEYAYVPDDLLPMIRGNPQPNATAAEGALGRPATAPEYAHVVPATDQLLDDMTTLLAAKRIGEARVGDPRAGPGLRGPLDEPPACGAGTAAKTPGWPAQRIVVESAELHRRNQGPVPGLPAPGRRL
jgi:hypothetical protein